MKIENQNRDHCCFIPSRFPCKINLQLIPNSRFPDLALMNFLIFFRFVERSSFFKSQSHQDWNCCFRQLSPVTGMFNVHRVEVSCKSRLHQWDTNIYPTDQKTIKSDQSKGLFLQVLPVCWKLPQTRIFGDNGQILASISSKMLYFQFMLDGICRNFSNLNGSMEACGIIYAKFDHFHSPWGGWGHKRQVERPEASWQPTVPTGGPLTWPQVAQVVPNSSVLPTHLTWTHLIISTDPLDHTLKLQITNEYK